MRMLIGVAVCAAVCSAGAVRAGDDWTHTLLSDDIENPANAVQFLARGLDGRTWIGTSAGLACWRNGKVTFVADEKGERLGVAAYAVLEIGEDDFWIGHGGGAIHVRAGRMEHSLQGRRVAPIVRVNGGVLWALGKDGQDRSALYENADGAWKPVPRFAKERVVDLFQSSDGALWLTIEGNGIHQIDPRKGIEASVHHLKGLNVNAVAQDARRHVWCGLWGRGLREFDGQKWTEHLPQCAAAFLGIAFDAGGAVYAATDRGEVWRGDGTTWRKDLVNEGAVHLLAGTADGRVWVNSQAVEGLRWRDGTKWVVSLASALPVRCVLQAADGALVAGGVLDGIYTLRR